MWISVVVVVLYVMAKNPRLIDMSGRRCGKWSVLRQNGNHPRGGALWLCRCDCGTERGVSGSDLRSGKSVSCGCEGAIKIGALNRTHAKSGTRLHRTWKNIRKRCLNANDPGFNLYGGRGISICPEWDDFSAFESWALTSGYRDDLSIERLDVDGDYTPSNCVWATSQVQNENRRFVSKAPSGRLWVHIARDNGITDSAYRSRLNDGWERHQAATWPMGKKRNERSRDSKGKFI